MSINQNKDPKSSSIMMVRLVYRYILEYRLRSLRNVSVFIIVYNIFRIDLKAFLVFTNIAQRLLSIVRFAATKVDSQRRRRWHCIVQNDPASKITFTKKKIENEKKNLNPDP